MKRNFLAAGAAALCALIASGCNSDEDNNPVNDKGTISFYLVDAPVDFVSSVVVKVVGAELTKADGSKVTLNLDNNQVRIDLLASASGDAQFAVDTEEVDTDDYTAVSLQISSAAGDNYVEADANGDGVLEKYPLTVDGGVISSSGDFTVPESGGETRTLEVNLRQSLTGDVDSGSFMLASNAEMLDDVDDLGSISGTVDTNGAADAVCEQENSTVAVYVYQGTPTNLGDTGNTTGAADPYSSGIVNNNDGSYTVQYLPPGTYTVAYTCEAGLDLPESSETLVYSDPKTVTVKEGEDSGLSF
jgi:hypothetical protein